MQQELKIKHRQRVSENIRVPSLNFHSEYFTIEWQAIIIDRYETTLMKHRSDDEVAACVETSDLAHVCAIATCPSQTQVTERYIRFVTETSTAVCGEDARDGFICS